MPDAADLLITGGTVVDGTGADGFAADIAVIEGLIHVIRENARRPSSVQSTIDATGKVVCPGFIDLHSHSGL
ncbi:MAG: D-aminoacylase, partial [Chloroflexi bacterium]